MDAFDAAILLYAVQDDHRGKDVRDLLLTPRAADSWIGSVLFIPEVLSHPIRSENDVELRKLEELLVLLELKPIVSATADLAAEFGAKYNLCAADAIHLAIAALWGASRFHTNNSKDFGQYIDEIEIVLPHA